MALVVGINIAVSLSVAHKNPSLALTAFVKFYPLHWFGVVLIFFSGLALLIAYPAKALSNPVFYVKCAALITGLIIARRMQQQLGNIESSQPLPQSMKALGAYSCLCWVVTIAAGRFLAYTHSVLLASSFY